MSNAPGSTGKYYTAIPDPTADPESLRQAIIAIKSTIEVLTHQRKPFNAAAITFQDLIDIGLLGADGASLKDNGTLLNQSQSLFSSYTPAQISAILAAAAALDPTLVASMLVGAGTAGGNKGAGSINAATIYLAGVALGSAATKNVGVAANNIPQLDGSAKLPPVDGSQLTNIAGKLVAGTSLVMNPYAINSGGTQAHGLGVFPALVASILECLTTDAGYAVGDQLAEALPTWITIAAGGTNLVLSTFNGAPGIMHKSTHVATTITAAKWKLTLVPYRLT